MNKKMQRMLYLNYMAIMHSSSWSWHCAVHVVICLFCSKLIYNNHSYSWKNLLRFEMFLKQDKGLVNFVCLCTLHFNDITSISNNIWDLFCDVAFQMLLSFYCRPFFRTLLFPLRSPDCKEFASAVFCWIPDVLSSGIVWLAACSTQFPRLGFLHIQKQSRGGTWTTKSLMLEFIHCTPAS